MEEQEKAKGLVRDWVNAHLDKSDPKQEFDVFVVWYCYVLGGWKALLSTTLPDGMYYEVTYNRVMGETYLDAYKKFDNVTFKS
jgi:hypothetical protein